MEKHEKMQQDIFFEDMCIFENLWSEKIETYSFW